MTKALFFLTAVCTSFVLQAQCDEIVTDFGNNTSIPAYNVTGDVDLILNEDSSITLNLASNFMTAAGPDIRAFLVNSNGASAQTLASSTIDNFENIEFGLVGGGGTNQNGAKSFTIEVPEESNIEDFDRVFFYCLQFNQFWDFGSFEPFNEANCSVLNTETVALESLRIFPNPANDQIAVSQIGVDMQLAIYTLTGELVKQQVLTSSGNTVDTSSISTGLYMVTLLSPEGTRSVQRLLIQ